jgi:hypothetical protein
MSAIGILLCIVFAIAADRYRAGRRAAAAGNR